MLIGEPPPTQADLHFRVFGFPVRVHPFFWLVTFLLGSKSDEPTQIFVWVAVVFFSILVHELGHATMQRRYGGHPRITLYSFGGLASCGDCDRSPSSQLMILFAGPLAGFLLAGVVVVGLMASGHFIGWELDWVPVRWKFFDPAHILEKRNLGLADLVIWDLLAINIMWGLINLLPVYPLDGGQISRELFTLGNPRSGIIQSLQLSIGVAVLIAAYFLMQQRYYTGLMFGYLAYSNFQTFQAYRNNWR